MKAINDSFSNNKINSSSIEELPSYYQCPDCEIGDEFPSIIFENNMLVAKCKKGHKFILSNNDDYKKVIQKNPLNAICFNCKKSRSKNNSPFFINIDNKNLLCNLCKEKTERNDRTEEGEKYLNKFVNLDLYFTQCSIHKQNYSIYCKEHNKNLCYKCYTDNHFQCKNICYLNTLEPSKKIIKKYLKSLDDKEKYLISKEIEINDLITNLKNEFLNYKNSCLARINSEKIIINCYNNIKSNYSIIQNCNEIMDKNNTFNYDAIFSKELQLAFNKFMNRTTSKNKIKSTEFLKYVILIGFLLVFICGLIEFHFLNNNANLLKNQNEQFVKDEINREWQESIGNLNVSFNIEIDDKSNKDETTLYNIEELKAKGKGIFTFTNGAVYNGEYINGKAHGLGVYKLKNGDEYRGEFKEGKFHGKGKYRTNQGDIYEGDFKNNQKDGMGTIRFNNGDIYEGEIKDDQVSGKGILKLKNGETYKGEFLEGKRKGKGIFTFKDGNVYEGEFDNDKFNGIGVLTFQNGNVYKGEFKNNQFNGKGTFTFKDGDSFESEYIEGKSVGKGTYYCKNGGKKFLDLSKEKK